MSHTYKAIIVDDEERSRQTLNGLIKRYCPEVNVIGEAASVAEAKELLATNSPDVVFLDISLPDGTGCDLLEQLPDRRFDVIFTTAHDEYSLKAFHYAALHYLLKPISYVQLREAVARMKPPAAGEPDERYRVMHEQLREERKSIVLTSLEGFSIAQLDDIVRCEADSNYTHIIFSKEKPFVASRNLSHFEELLSDAGFVRVHSKHLVNVKHVRRYHRGRGGYVEMSDGSQVEVSVRKKDEFLEKMAAFARGI
jgi:two-component system, LytTR family, response regulator